MLKWINSNISKPAPKQTHHPPTTPPPTHPDLLPDNLAGRILDLEFQSETQAISKDLVASLTCLYIEAVQFYQSRNNDKFKTYHKRMENFLKRPAIDSILRGKSGTLVNKKEQTEHTVNKARHKSKSEVTRILKQSDTKANKQRNMVSKLIEDQNEKLEARIHKRRTMSNRSVYSEREEDLPEEMPQNKLNGIDLVEYKLNSGRQPKRVFI